MKSRNWLAEIDRGEKCNAFENMYCKIPYKQENGVLYTDENKKGVNL